MAVGPVQLIVRGFNHPDFHGEVISELERLRASGTVRVIDSIVVYKDAGGELEEHHWAVPLRDAIARAGGFRLSDGFISPVDLAGIGLMPAGEAKELHAMETSGAASGGRQKEYREA
jgi:hypothetical protein